MTKFTEHIPPPCHEEVEILHVDADIVVVVKPSGLLSVPGRYVKDCLHYRMMFEYADVQVIHRLDLDTSGVMVLARSKRAAQSLSAQFREREVGKEYVAVVWGHVDPPIGTLDFPLAADPVQRPRHLVSKGGREAITDYEVQAQIGANSRLRLKPLTGRSHQLRVHLAHIGHPILGCDLYAHSNAFKAADRLMLHAEKLTFKHPLSGKQLSFSTPPQF